MFSVFLVAIVFAWPLILLHPLRIDAFPLGHPQVLNPKEYNENLGMACYEKGEEEFPEMSGKIVAIGAGDARALLPRYCCSMTPPCPVCPPFHACRGFLRVYR